MRSQEELREFADRHTHILAELAAEPTLCLEKIQIIMQCIIVCAMRKEQFYDI